MEQQPSQAQHLIAWSQPDLPTGIALEAEAKVVARILVIDYTLHWQAADEPRLLQSPSGGLRLPHRCDELWQHTCFEAFVGVRGEDRYWEINLAPSGDWNVYRFSAYRQDLQPELSLSALPFCRRLVRSSEGACLQLRLRCPLPPELAAGLELQLGLTAVVALGHGELSYWSLCHPADQPDFHDRRGWILTL